MRTKSLSVMKLLFAVFEIAVESVDHICGPDCPCWTEEFEMKLKSPAPPMVAEVAGQ